MKVVETTPKPVERTFDLIGLTEQQMWLLAALTGRCPIGESIYPYLADAGFANFDSSGARSNPISIHNRPDGHFTIMSKDA
jgi:hypothetical protein